jgi:hypothetical protein
VTVSSGHRHDVQARDACRHREAPVLSGPAVSSCALRFAVPLVVCVAALVLLVSSPPLPGAGPEGSTGPEGSGSQEAVAASPEPERTWSFTRTGNPPGTVVEDPDGSWIATFTDDASTVIVAGPERTFDDPTATNPVTTDVWVRLLPTPFDGEIDVEWLRATQESEEPDVLEVAMQYLDEAPEIRDDDGILIAGDASYGPVQPDGTRAIGSDWHDYRGVDTSYGRRIDPADPEEYGALDCSGYTRTVYGARLGVPLSLRPDRGTSLPRRSFEQAAEAPGVVPITGGELDEERLQTGDLVFFDLDSSRPRIDHVGIYVGEDTGGDHRFVHSRPTADGPTMGGDDRGPSILNGDGRYAEGFVSTRRL